MDIQKQKEIKLHKKLVKQYEVRYKQDYSRIYHGFWNKVLLEGLPGDNNSYVLDCGCGSGILLEELVKVYKNAIGMDLSFELADSMVQSRSINFKGLVIGDAEDLPFSDESFDIIICRGTLHHLPSPQDAIRTIYSKLKPGGFFVLSEPCDDSLLLRLPRKIWRRRSNRFTQGHKAFRSKALKEILISRGFKIKQARNFGLIALPLCGLSDLLPVMNFLIFRKAITQMLIFLDEVCSRIPLLRNQCWHIIIKAQKQEVSYRSTNCSN